jgi:hypothetical protein
MSLQLVPKANKEENPQADILLIKQEHFNEALI